MTSRELTRIGKRFMKRLQMDEWIPRAKFRIVHNLANEQGDELHGQSQWFPEERQCWIVVRPTEDADLLGETLVHEILHVRLEGHLPPSEVEKYDPAYEYALNCTARAIWKEWKEQA
jgi:hypothetical protein